MRNPVVILTRILFIIGIVSLLLKLFNGVNRNIGNLQVVRGAGNIQLLSSISEKRARSAQITLSYLDLADQFMQSGDLEVAKSFWKSALMQGAYNSGDFLVRYRFFWLAQQLGGMKVDNVLTTGKFRIDAIIALMDPGFWPPEPARVVDIARKQDWTTPELYIYLAGSYSRAGFYNEGLDILDATSRFSSGEWLYLKKGQIQETRRLYVVGLLRSSLDSYTKAYNLAPLQPFAADRLIQIYRSLGESSQAQKWEDVLIHSLAARRPEYTINQQVNDDWLLLGYDLQEEMLGLDGVGPAPMCLWWSYTGSSEFSGLEGYSLPDGTLVQCLQATNLAQNGAFELDGNTGEKFPIGFESDWFDIDYDIPLDLHHVSSDPSGDRSGYIAWLSNTPDSRYTSFQSSMIDIDQQAAYLQAAYVRTSGGHAYLGSLWLKQDYAFNGYSYVASGNPDTWTHWAGLAFPPEGTIATRIWLVNYENQGSAYFDNVLFVEVQLP